MRRSLLFVPILALALAACAPEAAPAPTAMATNAPTISATVTMVPTITPTLGPTVTELVSKFGFRGDRQYVIAQKGENTCVIDTYNQACMALKNSAAGDWTELDETNPDQVELMYGQLVPSEENDVNKGNIIMDNEYSSLKTRMYYTGNWFEQPGSNGSTLLVMKMVLRDNNELHMVDLVADAYGGNLVDHNRPFHFTFLDEPGSDGAIFKDEKDPLEVLLPGAVIIVDLPFPSIGSSSKVQIQPYEKQGYAKNNNQAQIALSQEYNIHPETHFTEAEIKEMSNGNWPNRQMTIYGLGLMHIELATYDDMKDYLFIN